MSSIDLSIFFLQNCLVYRGFLKVTQNLKKWLYKHQNLNGRFFQILWHSQNILTLLLKKKSYALGQMNSVWEEEESRARLETIIASRNLNNCIWSLWGTLPPTCHYGTNFRILSKFDEAFFHFKNKFEIWLTLQISYL